MVIRELVKETAALLSGIENHMFETHLIVRTVLGLSPMDLVLSHKSEADDEAVEKIRSYAQRRINGEPIQYILGTQEFMGIEFEVDKNVLIPRADTETLVEVVLKQLSGNGASMLDIGCGSGCVGLSAAYHNNRIYLRGIDISLAATALSRKNAERLGISERADFTVCDIMTEHLSGKYDVIVSNPPYIRTDVIPTLMREVQCFEPHLALDGGADGLKFYRRIVSEAKILLNENGFLAFEIGYDQGESVSELMADGFCDVTVTKDLCGNDRVVSGRRKY
ncbi:MAG: peptide chain release factor N(5)-glutamine methyltransferase [Clostridia bacterium]|nr:peptide chain release factor N(5)-glutamine methyltransferase [Clostridia bacterium]